MRRGGALLCLLLLCGCRSSPPELPEGGRRPGTPGRPLQPYRALESTDARERVAGINLLIHTADAGAPSRLRPLLQDPAPEVRAAAVNGLRLLGGRSDTPAVRRLLEDPEPAVRREVVRFLAGHGGTRALPDLRATLTRDPSPEVRALAVLSMGALDPTGQDLDGVLALLQDDPEEAPILRAALIEYVRRHAARVRDPAVLTGLMVTLLGDPSPEVRMAAARALGQGGEARALEPLRRRFREDRDPYARAEALLACGRLGDRGLAADCRDLLTSRHHWILQAAAASYLGQVHAGAAEQELLASCLLERGRDARVRETAAAALGRLGNRAALDLALEEGDRTARRAALLAYPHDDREGLLRLARGLATSPDEDLRWAALQVRGRLRDATAYPGLVEGLRGGFGRATDALGILLEITGGDPNHGFRYEDWLAWAQAQH